MIPREKIDEIMQTARIEEVVGDFVSLRKRGSNMWGNCPFHNEKTPSFSVNPARNIFKCFGCGKAGNSVTFLMEHEHFTYQEALRYLAKKYRITIEEQELTPEQITERSKRESLFNLSNFAQTFFVDNLWNTDEGKSIGLSYFRERGYFDPIIEKFGLGYSPQQWEALSKYAMENGYSQELLVELGLSLMGKKGPYDRFHGRVMFPIHDVGGRVIGFGGRILTANKDKKDPKYQNSPESEIYDKKKTLYGIYFAKNAIIKADECILVEGYFDVLRMHQSGIENVVASSGTSLTEEQIKLINRYTKNITILYDGDAAGQKASLRGTDMILAAGMNVRVVSLPPEHDPDTFAKDYPIEEVQRYLKEHARDFIRFKTELLMHDAANDPIKRAEAIRDIVVSISVIPDPIFRSTYVRECSSLLNIKEEILIGELNKMLVKDFKKKLGIAQETIPDEPIATTPQEEEKIDDGNKAMHTQEQELVRLMLLYGQNVITENSIDDSGNQVTEEYPLAVYIIDDLKADGIVFEDAVCKRIFDIYDSEIDEGDLPDDKYFVTHEDSEISQLAATLLSTPYKLDNWKKHGIEIKQEADDLKSAAMSSIVRYKELVLVLRRHALEKELSEADTDDQLIIMKQIKDLDEIRMRLNKYIGTVVTR